jgi:hypothetical protein
MTERHTWVPYVGIIAGALLLLKAALIIGSENRVSEGAMAMLYLGGILLAVVACVGVGLRQRRGRRTLAGVGSVLAVLAFVMVLSDGVAGIFAAMSDAPWVGDEGPVGLLGLLLVLAFSRLQAGARTSGTAVRAAT